MKLHTRILALLLILGLVFSLAACSDSGTKYGSAVSTNSSAAPSSDPFPSASGSTGDISDVDTSVEDLSLATVGIPGNFELLTIDGVPVNTRTYLYLLAYSISYFEQYAAYFGQSLVWEDEITDGTTLSEFVKQDALDAALYYTIVAAKAKELGFELTQEQTDTLKEKLDTLIENLGGEEVYQDQLRMSGLDHDSFYALQSVSYYYDQLCAGLYPDGPSDKEMADYIEDNDILYAKHILLLTVDSTTREPLEDSVIAEQRDKAESLLSQLQAADEEERLDLFDELMFEYSEDTGLLSNPDGYIFTAGDFVSAFENTTRALEFGQISDVVESEWGYHIILRLDPADNEDIQESCFDNLMDTLINTWADEADIVLSDAYKALDAQSFYENYVRYQEAFAAELQAEAQG